MGGKDLCGRQAEVLQEEGESEVGKEKMDLEKRVVGVVVAIVVSSGDECWMVVALVVVLVYGGGSGDCG